MIGLSVSYCIIDICTGKVNALEVEKIIAGTKCRDQKDWDEVIAIYQKRYWSAFPEEARRTIQWFIDQGKVEQPRLDSRELPKLDSGFWLMSPDQVELTMSVGEYAAGRQKAKALQQEAI